MKVRRAIGQWGWGMLLSTLPMVLVAGIVYGFMKRLIHRGCNMPRVTAEVKGSSIVFSIPELVERKRLSG